MAVIHLITPEFPPARGGVADYTRTLAEGLAAAGDDVHVWCPQGAVADHDGFTVHAELGSFRRGDLQRTGEMLDRFTAPRRVIVQWVPHGYGRRSMNLPLCFWLLQRSRRGDRIELMVHEPFLAFAENGIVHAAIAAVHRAMTVVLLRAACRVWTSIPAWEGKWRPYTLGRRLPFAWLPIPSNLHAPDAATVDAIRARLRVDAECVVGHLGSYGPTVTSLLAPMALDVLTRNPRLKLVLIGNHSDRMRSTLCAGHQDLSDRVVATGYVSDEELSAYVAACDLLVQPYPDGVSSRRTTTMAGLRLGVPIVTTTGHLTETFWAASSLVRLVPVGDARAMSLAVEGVLADPAEQKRLASCARAYYDQSFDLRRTVETLRSAA